MSRIQGLFKQKTENNDNGVKLPTRGTKDKVGLTVGCLGSRMVRKNMEP